jgi:hypothetical protein
MHPLSTRPPAGPTANIGSPESARPGGTALPPNPQRVPAGASQVADKALVAQALPKWLPPMVRHQFIQSANFGSGKAFRNTTEAYIAAFVEIDQRMRADGGKVEYGFELMPGANRTVTLGHLIRGDERSVSATMSDAGSPFGVYLRNYPFSRFVGGGNTNRSSGHSHPLIRGDRTNLELSYADTTAWLTSRPLGGQIMTAVYDYEAGRGYKLELDARVPIPQSLHGSGPGWEDVLPLRNWLKQQLDTGKLRVTAIVERESVGGPRGVEIAIGNREMWQPVWVRASEIQISPQLRRLPDLPK